MPGVVVSLTGYGQNYIQAQAMTAEARSDVPSMSPAMMFLQDISTGDFSAFM